MSEFIPPRLEKLHSQPEAQKLLLALKTKGGAQTFLWTGPAGVGKKTHALALVRSLFCRQGEDCPGCPDCKQVLTKSHADLYWVDREHFWAEKDKDKKSDGIFADTIRGLSQKLSQAPFSAPLKVAVIPDAGGMTDEAQNIFLKTLEEPSGDTVIILIAEKKGDLIPTVLSRCRPVRFGALADAALVKILAESHGWEKNEAKQAVKTAQGSITLALREADPAWKEFREKVEKDLDQVLQGPEEGWLALSTEYDQWEPDVLDDSERTATQRKAQVLNLAFGVWTNLWVRRSAGQSPVPKAWEVFHAADVLKCLSLHQQMVPTNLQARMILDHLFMELRDGAKRGELRNRPLTELTI